MVSMEDYSFLAVVDHTQFEETGKDFVQTVQIIFDLEFDAHCRDYACESEMIRATA